MLRMKRRWNGTSKPGPKLCIEGFFLGSFVEGQGRGRGARNRESLTTNVVTSQNTPREDYKILKRRRKRVQSLGRSQNALRREVFYASPGVEFRASVKTARPRGVWGGGRWGQSLLARHFGTTRGRKYFGPKVGEVVGGWSVGGAVVS